MNNSFIGIFNKTKNRKNGTAAPIALKAELAKDYNVPLTHEEKPGGHVEFKLTFEPDAEAKKAATQP